MTSISTTTLTPKRVRWAPEYRIPPAAPIKNSMSKKRNKSALPSIKFPHDGPLYHILVSKDSSAIDGRSPNYPIGTKEALELLDYKNDYESVAPLQSPILHSPLPRHVRPVGHP